jgi:ABC-type polysaccharide/polyol phosphate transport system ATPase subunit
MSSIAAIGATVRFPLYDAWSRSFKRRFVQVSAGQGLGTTDGNKVHIPALVDVSLQIDGGDRVAVLGGNGSGKTSLLRVLGGMLTPLDGTVDVVGRPAAILDIGFGFDANASAYETIVLQGILLGRTRAAIRQAVVDVAAFGDLAGELGSPIRNLTPGHIFRLGTGMAFAFGADIILYDEVFEAASPEFVAKTKAYFDTTFPKDGIVIVVERSRAILEGMCNKALVIEAGRILEFDAFDAVMSRHGSTYTI